MNILHILREADVLNPKTSVDTQSPLKDNKTIRVYHGFNDAKDLANTLIHGLSGSRRAKRLYSYEASNNPRGLFVTIDFNAAKRFGAYVIEFHAKVSDLEAPVWKGGNYTIQGGYAQYYKDEDERKRDQAQLRKDQAQSPHKAISKSDRPDVAHRLFDYSENQALFTGDLNHNSIRAVWISSNPKRVSQTYKRYSPKQALRMIQKGELETAYGAYSHEKNQTDDHHGYHLKQFKPREKASLAKLVDKLAAKHTISKDEIKGFLMEPHGKEYIRQSTWSEKQYRDILKDIANVT